MTNREQQAIEHVTKEIIMAIAKANAPKSESERIVEWRHGQLVQAGYDQMQASYLAQSSDVDLHLATQLVENGCSPNLAIRIV